MIILSTASLAAGRDNQDQMAHIDLGNTNLLLVADGAGGMAGGARAACRLIEALAKAAPRLTHSAKHCAEWLAEMDQSLFCDALAGESTAVLLVIKDSELFGASVGDSRAWLIDEGQHTDLTAHQERKPLLGSGLALPRRFGPHVWRGTLLLGTDGLFNYIPLGSLITLVSKTSSDNMADFLCNAAKLPSGELADDVTAMVCSKIPPFHPLQTPPTRIDAHDRLRGLLLGGLLGDALGAPFEGTPIGALGRLQRQLASRIEGPGPWGYTDDTEMAFGVAESLAQCNGLAQQHLLSTLARNHSVTRGYGKGTRRAFEALHLGESWQSVRYSSWSDGSRGNGGAARVGALAWFYQADEMKMLEAAEKSAAVTHAHPHAQMGAKLLAQMIAIAANSLTTNICPQTALHRLVQLASSDTEYLQRLHTIEDLLCHPDPSKVDVVSRLGHGVLAIESVPLALYSFLRWHSSFEKAVQQAIEFGGDTDTIGAMTGTLVGALHGYSACPKAWLKKLERHSVDCALQLSSSLVKMGANG